MKEDSVTLVPNRPTPEGIEAGKKLADMGDRAEAKHLEKFPKARKRCNSCAYRLGTLPNGCLPTVMDALKCSMEGRPFLCHEKVNTPDADKLCAGWAASIYAAGGHKFKPVKVPWDYDCDNIPSNKKGN